MNDGADAGGVRDAAEIFFPVETREEIIGKERLGEPLQPTFGRALEFDAREEDFHLYFAFQEGGRDMLMLGLRADTEPEENGKSRSWRAWVRFWIGIHQKEGWRPREAAAKKKRPLLL
jgi:hypothetical protein